MAKSYLLSSSTAARLQQLLGGRSVDATGTGGYTMRGEGGVKMPLPFAVRFSVQADSFLVYIPENGALLGVDGYAIAASPPSTTKTYTPPKDWYAAPGRENIYAVISRETESSYTGDTHPGDGTAYSLDLAAEPSEEEGAVNILLAAILPVESSSGSDAWLIAQCVTGAIALPGSGRGDADTSESQLSIQTGPFGLQLYGVDAESLGEGDTLLDAVTPKLEGENLTPGKGMENIFVVAIDDSGDGRKVIYIPFGTGEGDGPGGGPGSDTDCEDHPGDIFDHTNDSDHPGDVHPGGSTTGEAHPGDSPNWCK